MQGLGLGIRDGLSDMMEGAGKTVGRVGHFARKKAQVELKVMLAEVRRVLVEGRTTDETLDAWREARGGCHFINQWRNILWKLMTGFFAIDKGIDI